MMRWSLLPAVTLLWWSTSARADWGAGAMEMPTDGANPTLFSGNPAQQKLRGFSAGVLAIKQDRESILDHTAEAGDKLDTKVSDNIGAAALSFDMGAGAGVILTQRAEFRKATTQIDDQPANGQAAELARNQESSLILQVELTDGLVAAINVRYLQKSVTIYGDPFLGATQSTHYSTSMVGYGSGFSYAGKTAGIGYTYNPPIQGKAEIYGQEEIINEPGDMGVNLFWQPTSTLTLGLSGKHWINVADDLAAGSTAPDDKTQISLYGLDPDQYLLRDNFVQAGADIALSKPLVLRLAIGREWGHFDFSDYFVYDRIEVKTQATDRVSTDHGRVALHGTYERTDLDLGADYYNRKHVFGDANGGGTYTARGMAYFATLALHL